MAYIPSECSVEEYEKVIYSGDAKNRLYVKHGDTIIGTNGDNNASPFASKLTLKRRILKNGSKTVTLNNFISQELDLVLHDYKIEDLSEEVEIKIGTFIDNVNDYVYVPIGKFLIQDNPTTDKNKTTYKLRDFSVKFDFYYNAKTLIDNNGGKATKLQILKDICEQAGVVCNIQNFIGFDDEIGIYDNTVTARTYISYLAEQAGKLATINRQGELIFVDLVSDEKFIESSNPDYPNQIKDALEREVDSFIVEGNSYQETRSGMNLYNYKDFAEPPNGAVLGDDGWVTLTIDNADGTSTKYLNFFTNSLNIKPSTDYNIIVEVKEKSGVGTLDVTSILYSTTDIQGQFPFWDITLANLNNGGIYQRVLTSRDVSDSAKYGLRTFLAVGAGNVGSVTFRISVLEDTTITPETFKYEAFGKSPTPEYPSEIETVEDINIKVVGKNLLQIKDGTYTSNGITLTIKDNILTFNGTNNGTESVFMLSTNEVNTKESTRIKCFQFGGSVSNENSPNFYSYVGWSNIIVVNFTTSTIKYLDDNLTYNNFNIGIKSGTFDNYSVGVLIEEDITDETSYEPYKETIISYDLQGNELVSIGNVKDEIDIVTGTLTKRIGKIVLDGSEYWAFSSSQNNDSYNTIYVSIVNNDVKMDGKIISSYFENKYLWDNDVIGIWVGKSYNINIRIPKEIASTSEEFKAWLSENNVTVYYELKEPQIIKLNKQDVKLFEGTNNLTPYTGIDTKIKMIYDVPKNPHIIPHSIVEKFTNAEKYKVSKILYESGVNKYEGGNDDADTLYINEINPYIKDEAQIQKIANNINGFEINSFKTGKVLGNPLIDAYDLIKLEYDGIIYKTLSQYTLNFSGTMTSNYETTVEHEAKQSNVANKGFSTIKKFVKAEIDNVDAKFTVEVGEINGELSNLDTNINNTADRVSNTETKINDTNSNLENLIGRTTKLEQDNQGWSFEFNNIYEDLSELNKKTSETDKTTKEIKDYIRFENGNIILEGTDSKCKVVISKEKISFYTDDNESAYISNNELYINDNTVLNKQTIGKWEVKPDSEGNLNTRWIG